MKYPKVIDEFQTLSAAMTNSLARYGDGELSLALGGDCVSQRRDPRLAKELREILENRSKEVLVGIPNLDSPTKQAWAKYRADRYVLMYGKGIFGSAFITRPDSAPWIDTPEFWQQLRRLWIGKNVVLVKGTERSLRADQLVGVGQLTEVTGPRRDAYAVIDQLEEQIGRPSGTVLLCLGPCATVLAARLAKKGVHAVDLGHVGMFMRHAGAYKHKVEELISPRYREQLERLRDERAKGKGKKFGADGAKHVDAVLAFFDELQPATTLDYGCGEGRLAIAVKERRPEIRVQEYDPGVKGKGGLPKPCDLVVATDVLEHVERDKVGAVLDHIFSVTGKGAYLVIATREANAVLPDGRNAHLIVEPSSWWLDKIHKQGWTVQRVTENPGRDVTLWLRK